MRCDCFVKVRIENKEHAKYVESQVPAYIWKVSLYLYLYLFLFMLLSSVSAYLLNSLVPLSSVFQSFVTQNDEDRDLLVRNLKQYDVPIINQRPQHNRQAPRMVTPAVKNSQTISTPGTFLSSPKYLSSRSIYNLRNLEVQNISFAVYFWLWTEFRHDRSHMIRHISNTVLEQGVSSWQIYIRSVISRSFRKEARSISTDK